MGGARRGERLQKGFTLESGSKGRPGGPGHGLENLKINFKFSHILDVFASAGDTMYSPD